MLRGVDPASSDDDDREFEASAAGRGGGGTRAAAKASAARLVAEEFGLRAGDLPATLLGVDVLGRLNLRPILADEMRQLATELEAETREQIQARAPPKTGSASASTAVPTAPAGAAASAAQRAATSDAPARRQRGAAADEEPRASSALSLSLLEQFDGATFGPRASVSARRRAALCWRSAVPAPSTGVVAGAVAAVPPRVPRVCACCMRLARFRCPECAGRSASASTQFGDPDGGLVCSRACLEVHAATRCGKHVA
jgi:hypothetical protein